MKLLDTALTYVHAGLFVTDEAWIHPARTESTYELICVEEGTVHLEEAGVNHTLQKGSLLILRPGIPHSGCLYSTGKTAFYWAHFHMAEADFAGLVIRGYSVGRFTDMAMFRRLLHIANTRGYPPYAAEAALLSILAEAARLSNQEDISDSPVVRNAAEWIRINSQQKLTAALVAQKYGYSGEHFSRMFRVVYGMGLKEYICGARIGEARNLLLNSAYSIKQVAALLSFDDENQFVHFFKYHQKQSPKQFRNSIYNVHMNRK